MASSTHPQSPRKPRPQSTLAQDFSAALDEMFKLNGLGALELSVEEKKDEVQTQKRQLDSLEQQLRETEERLKKLEAKNQHHRNRSQNTLENTRHVTPVMENENENEQETDDSGGDSRSERDYAQRRSR